MEDLLQLSDEYQVTKLIFDPCVKFLEGQAKTKENVMKILAIANLYNLEKVRQSCINLLKNMRLESLSETVHLQDLDKEKTQYYLTQRIERLEGIIDGVFPQVFGLVFSLMRLLHNSEVREQVEWCSKHVCNGNFKMHRLLEIKQCEGCQDMLESIVDATCSYGSSSPRVNFNENLFSVMHDLKVTKKKWDTLYNKEEVLDRLIS